jgi:hypothetical protein
LTESRPNHHCWIAVAFVRAVVGDVVVVVELGLAVGQPMALVDCFGVAVVVSYF